MKEHFLVRAMHHYATDWESPFCRHVYETELTSVRLNFVYLHFWLCNYHFNRPVKDVEAFIDKLGESKHNIYRASAKLRTIKKLEDRMVGSEHVLTYTNSHDDSIHEELKR